MIDKEKLNRLRCNIDILSLSATPIPRSLNFALNGVKSISTLSTPIPSNKPIETFVSRWNDTIVGKALRTELDRG